MLQSIRQLSEMTGFDRATVKNRLERAKLKPTKSGRAHLYESRDALPVLYLTIEDGTLDLNAERARLAHHQANRAEIEADRLAGKLVPVEDVVHHWSTMIAASRARLLALPSRLVGPVTAGLTPREVEHAARDIVYEALSELAEAGVPENPVD